MRTLEEIIAQLTAKELAQIQQGITAPNIKSSVTNKNTFLVDYDMNTLTKGENDILHVFDNTCRNFLLDLNVIYYHYTNNVDKEAGRKEYADVVKKYFEKIRSIISAAESAIYAKESELKQIATSISSTIATDEANNTVHKLINNGNYSEKTIDVVAKEKYDAELEEAILQYAKQQMAIEMTSQSQG